MNDQQKNSLAPEASESNEVDKTSLESPNADNKSLDNFTEQEIDGEKVLGGGFLLKYAYFAPS